MAQFTAIDNPPPIVENVISLSIIIPRLLDE
jgi:hypothetical protein